MITKRLRYEILRRDNHTCRYCGGKPPDVELAIDHVIPEALGGSDDSTNLVTACRDCNAGKSSSAPDAPIVANVADDAIRWSRALAVAAELTARQRLRLQNQVDDFDQTWLDWHHTHDQSKVERPADWKQSVEMWLKLGLTSQELCRFVESAMSKQNLRGYYPEWKYLCGIAWRTLEDRQELAQQLIDAGVMDDDEG